MTHWANTYVGIPFTLKGRSRKGFDCYGLLRDVYWKHKQVWLPLYTDEYRTLDAADTAPLIDCEKEVNWTKVKNPSEFDVVLFKIAGWATHVGVMLDSKQFVHVMKGRETTIESISHPLWNRRIEGFYQCNL